MQSLWMLEAALFTALTAAFAKSGAADFGACELLLWRSVLAVAALAAFAALRLKRRPDLRLIAAAAVGFSSVLIVLRPDFSSAEALPSLIGLTAGMFSTAAYLQIRALIRDGEPEWRIVFYFSLFGVGFGLLGTLLFEGGLTRITTENILPLLGMGVCAVLSQLSFTLSRGCKKSARYEHSAVFRYSFC